MFYLSSCSICKDEDSYIDDFVKIHKHLGVEFFLFFDRSKNPLSKRFSGRSDIQVIDFPEPNRHADAWKEGVKYFAGKSKWVQFIDIDQVTVPVKSDDLRSMLLPYEQFASLGLNWHTFGSNGLENEPTESTYQAYTKRAAANAGVNNHIQSIVQPDKAKPIKWGDPHHPYLKDNCHQVNERWQTFRGPFNIPPSQEVGFIAHYYTRSREYWAKKIAKNRADTGTAAGTMLDFDHHQEYMNVEDEFRVRDIWNRINDK
jgi:hypothetical protein